MLVEIGTWVETHRVCASCVLPDLKEKPHQLAMWFIGNEYLPSFTRNNRNSLKVICHVLTGIPQKLP